MQLIPVSSYIIENSKMSAVLLLFLFLPAVLQAQTQDKTLEAGAKGADVVEATLERIASSCAFSDDKLFARRVAAVESADGLSSQTYRTGYHGGIWQAWLSQINIYQYYFLRYNKFCR